MPKPIRLFSKGFSRSESLIRGRFRALGNFPQQAIGPRNQAAKIRGWTR
jgi:hypothetical protein